MAALLLFSIAQAFLIQLPYGSGTAHETFRVLLILPVYLTTALLCLVASRRSNGLRQRTWFFFALAFFAWTTGQGISAYLTAQGALTYPSVADIVYLLFVPLMLTGFLQLKGEAQRRATPLIMTLDIAIVLIASMAGYWHFFLSHNLHHPLSPLASAVTMAYPLSDLILFGLLVVVAVWSPGSFPTLRLLLVAFGNLSFLIGDTLYQMANVHGTYRPGEFIDLFWTFAALAIGLGAFLASRTGQIERIAQIEATFGRAWGRVAAILRETMPYGAVIFAIYLAVMHFFRPDGNAVGIIAAMVAVALLTLLRQGLMQLHSYRMQQQLDQQAKYDALTGLMNRTHLSERLSGLLEDARRNSKTVAVMFMDLDRFKFINDTYGHAAGDMVLRTVADRIRASVRQGDLVVRLGGDEFVIVLRTIKDAAEAGAAAQRILQSVGRPLELDDQDLSVTGSIGITLCPAEATDEATALRNADLAMYHAKERGRNAYCYYDPKLQVQNEGHRKLETQLVMALERGEFEVYYQPVVELSSRHIRSAEALLRWNSPVLGAVSPAQFIPVAEERGLIVEIGAWVLRQALTQVRTWRSAGHADIRVAVNVSPLQFQQDGFVELVERALRQHGLGGDALILELTEGSLIRDLEAANAKLVRLRELGVQIALDDFGTGYSSLAYLQQLQVDVVKIDRSFVQAMGETGPAVMEAILHLVRQLGYRTVAEGIETVAQYADLEGVGCDSGQGYLFARPVPAREFERVLAHYSRRETAPGD
ncbi:diguanylate cyclase (GGDEF)-like protein [Deinobacterium chartae]|uniref:Diguanylate cyclase (GGDEF)-like protein n=1 Tax=Deinobacterium chartae TaxID=521158 RepID=A0A841I641_9DEIO|nr:EAL domain-containing protein [Deinobacterium chartae]MBB6099729.1 diguanylate cyclase (GGDEF)-like protein [Deinobacterium chartae]